MRLISVFRNLYQSNPISSSIAAIGLTSLGVSSVLNTVTASEPRVSTVDQLVAIEEIEQLQARYYRCVDTKDWDCWRAIFASDFVFNTSRGVANGPEGMIDLVKRNGLYDRVKTVHHGHMPEVEILSPTTARGTWRADYMHFYPLGQPYETTGNEVAAPGKDNHSYAIYRETFIKRDGRWQMITMTQQQIRSDDHGGITIPPPPVAKQN